MISVIRRIVTLAAFFLATAAHAMTASSIPTKVPTYWGTGAQVGYITCPIPIPSQISIAAGRASWTDGFPPLVFTPVGAGGVPFFGQDLNGVLCQLSQWTRWYDAGAPIPYDSAFQSAVGGYPVDAIIASAATPGNFWINIVDNNTTDPDTGGAGWKPWPASGTGVGNVVGASASAVGNIPSFSNTSTTGIVDSGVAAASLQALLTVHDEFYVSPTGTDAGNCTNSGAPCLTLTYAAQQALNSNAGNNVQIINMAAGDWNETVDIQGTSPFSANTNHNDQLLFDGDGSGNTTWNGSGSNCGTLIANAGANVGIENLTIEAEQNACSSSLYAQLTGIIQVYGGVVFGAANVSHIHVEGEGSQVQIWNSYTVASGSYTLQSHMAAVSGGLIEINPTSVAVAFGSPSPTYSIGVFFAQVNGVIYLGQPGSFAGATPTGPKYSASTNATVFTDGYGCSNLPGTVAGATATNGICQ